MRAGAPLDPDLNKYDLNHVCTTHPRMSAEEWNRVYQLAWQRYYTTDHIANILRRVAASRGNAANALFLITWFKGSIDLERIHPLEAGFLRLKFRRDRRSGFEREPVWKFYPRYFGETAVKLARWTTLYLRLRRIYLRIKRDPQRFAYTDLATRVMNDEETSTLELFGTEVAQAYASEQRRLKDVRNARSGTVPAQPLASRVDV